jgi:hypothetical protein
VAGISQVWLTEKELTALDTALSAHIGYLWGWGPNPKPELVSGADKIKLALEPVACKV